MAEHMDKLEKEAEKILEISKESHENCQYLLGMSSHLTNVIGDLESTTTKLANLQSVVTTQNTTIMRLTQHLDHLEDELKVLAWYNRS